MPGRTNARSLKLKLDTWDVGIIVNCLRDYLNQGYFAGFGDRFVNSFKVLGKKKLVKNLEFKDSGRGL